MDQSTSVRNRDHLVRFLEQELVGPRPAGGRLDASGEQITVDENDLYRPWRQSDGEEILTLDRPGQRYGTAVLYPAEVLVESEEKTGSEDETDSEESRRDAGGLDSGGRNRVAADESEGDGDDTAGGANTQRAAYETGLKRGPKEFARKSGDGPAIDGGTATDEGDFDLSLANAYRPASAGLSLLAALPPGSRIIVEVGGGRYEPRRVQGGERSRLWWFRRRVQGSMLLEADEISGDEPCTLSRPLEASGLGPLKLEVQLRARPHTVARGGRSIEGSPQEDTSPEDDRRHETLLTVALVNRTPLGTRLDEACLFQAAMSVRLEAGGTAPHEKRVGSRGESTTGAHILPYPTADELGLADAKRRRESERERPGLQAALDEEESISLLYRDKRTYAIGHGCATDWGDANTEREHGGILSVARTTYLPRVELPSTTPDVTDHDGNTLQVPMAPLAGLDDSDDGMESLKAVVEAYRAWIERQAARIADLDARHRGAARRNVESARECADRMQDGLDFLAGDPVAARAFRLANHAILLQQIRAGDVREAKISKSKLSFVPAASDPDPLKPGPNRGKWRAFQIAFILMSIRSTAQGEAPYRSNVELIWFPTGGGKTEAYLGLAAFSIFLRRLRDPDDSGVQVLMRYTLRLLTAQQFQRAARLMCAIEHLRRTELGSAGEPVRIGIWVGGSSTPNTRKQALRALRELSSKRYAENPFIVRSCPWCNAEMGPVKNGNRISVQGYRQQGLSVELYCPDPTCDFRGGLPVRVVDEDLYRDRPEFIIGTIDKFAMLAWRPQARSLFGLGERGERVASPPGLIVQDELHLISGPLGTVAGLYEAVIEELCTDRRGEAPVPPKLVSSTATIRRYEDQIRSLYARDRSTLFPPPGLDADDSFFAQVARKENGKREPGRMYVGVHAPGLGSLQTVQIRTFAALLLWPVTLEDGRDRAIAQQEQDPYWTLLAFYNSLRELGGALSLFQDDIPAYIGGLRKRAGIDLKRFFNEPYVLELTGRIRGDEVPRAIGTLERRRGGKSKPVDACLASNIIEVGVDIDRLSLMGVVGQPKTTAQYIQVTGRVGRRWWERPGLVVTLYSASKPRDRSHFETFRPYHERLYAQVEPTSVTPFSPPALDRILHAAMVAHVRQRGDQSRSPDPVPEADIDSFRRLLEERVPVVDPTEAATLQDAFERRLEEWRLFKSLYWEPRSDSEDPEPGLMYASGSFVPEAHRERSWAVPMSMRNVDAECQLEIVSPVALNNLAGADASPHTLTPSGSDRGPRDSGGA